MTLEITGPMPFDHGGSQFISWQLMDGSTPAGAVTLKWNQRDAWEVSGTHIEPDYRKQGHGTRLYEAALQWMKDNDALMTTGGTMTPGAQALWAKLLREKQLYAQPVGRDPSEVRLEQENGSFVSGQDEYLGRGYRMATVRTAQAGPLVTFDFDDTLRAPNGDPLPGVAKAHEHLARGDRVLVVTSRAFSADSSVEIREFLDANGLGGVQVIQVDVPNWVLDLHREGQAQAHRQPPAPWAYHATLQGRLPSIRESGLDPSMGGSLMPAYGFNSRGKTFFAGPESLNYWRSKVYDHGNYGFDEPSRDTQVALLRFPVDILDGDIGYDELAARETSSADDSWFTTTPVPAHALDVWDGAEWVPLDQQHVDDFPDTYRRERDDSLYEEILEEEGYVDDEDDDRFHTYESVDFETDDLHLPDEYDPDNYGLPPRTAAVPQSLMFEDDVLLDRTLDDRRETLDGPGNDFPGAAPSHFLTDEMLQPGDAPQQPRDLDFHDEADTSGTMRALAEFCRQAGAPVLVNVEGGPFRLPIVEEALYAVQTGNFGAADRITVAAQVGRSDKQPWELTFREYIDAIDGNKTLEDYDPWQAQAWLDEPSQVIDRVELPDGRVAEFHLSQVAQQFTDGSIAPEPTISVVVDGQRVGYAGDSFGATEVFIAPEFQGTGIGQRLIFHWRRQFPTHTSGGLTRGGYRTNKHVHRMLVEDALYRGLPVPEHVLAEYPDIEAREYPPVADPGEAVEWEGPEVHHFSPPKGHWAESWPRTPFQDSTAEALAAAMGKPIEVGRRGPAGEPTSWRYPNGQPTPEEAVAFLEAQGIKPSGRGTYKFVVHDGMLKQAQVVPDDPELRRLSNALRRNFTPDLLQPGRKFDENLPSRGQCFAAVNAAYHFLGGPEGPWKPMNIRHEGDSHWYLQHKETGEVFDPTADQFETPVPYEQGKPKGMMAHDPNEPTGRGRKLMDRVINDEGERVARHQRTVCVDLDGTILGDPDYERPTPTEQPGLAEPNEGAAEKLQTLADQGWRIIIHTARFSMLPEENYEQAAAEIEAHLQNHGIPFDEIATGPKPVADYYVDDKAVPFESWDLVKLASHLRPPPAMWQLIEDHLAKNRGQDRIFIRYDPEGWHLADDVARSFARSERLLEEGKTKPGEYYSTQPFGLTVKFYDRFDPSAPKNPHYNPQEATLYTPTDRDKFDTALHEITHYVQHLLNGGRNDLYHSPGGMPATREGNPYYHAEEPDYDTSEAHSLSDIEFWPKLNEFIQRNQHITPEDFRQKVAPPPPMKEVPAGPFAGLARSIHESGRDPFFRTLYEWSPEKWREAVTHAYNNIFGKGFDRTRTNRPENYADTYEGVQEWVQLGDDPKLPRAAQDGVGGGESSRTAAGLEPYPDKTFRPHKQWLLSLPVPDWAQEALGVTNGHWSLAYVRGFPGQRPYAMLFEAIQKVAMRHQPFDLVTGDSFREMYRTPNGFEHQPADEPPPEGGQSLFTFVQPDPEGAARMTALANDLVATLQSAGFELRLFGEFLPHMSIPRATAEAGAIPPEPYPVDYIEVLFEGEEARVDLGTGQLHNFSIPLDEETDEPLDPEFVNPTQVELPTSRPGESKAAGVVSWPHESWATGPMGGPGGPHYPGGRKGRDGLGRDGRPAVGLRVPGAPRTADELNALPGNTGWEDWAGEAGSIEDADIREQARRVDKNAVTWQNQGHGASGVREGHRGRAGRGRLHGQRHRPGGAGLRAGVRRDARGGARRSGSGNRGAVPDENRLTCTDSELEAALKRLGGVRRDGGKHVIYTLPNGKNYTHSHSKRKYDGPRLKTFLTRAGIPPILVLWALRGERNLTKRERVALAGEWPEFGLSFPDPTQGDEAPVEGGTLPVDALSNVAREVAETLLEMDALTDPQARQAVPAYQAVPAEQREQLDDLIDFEIGIGKYATAQAAPRFRTKVERAGLVTSAYLGRKLVGRLSALWSTVGRIDERFQRDIDALGGADRYDPVLVIQGAEVKEEARGQGIGRGMYDELFREARAAKGEPFLAGGTQIGGYGGTSPDAQRVWNSLARDYPSSGPLIRIAQGNPLMGLRPALAAAAQQVYETGGGYNWQKIPDVTFQPDHVYVERIADEDYWDEALHFEGSRREADHFGNLPNTDAYFELREKGKLPEPTHRDVIPHLEGWEEDEVFDSFRDWWKDLEEAGLITDHDRWHEKTTSLVKVPVDQLVAGQKFTAGPTFSTGPGNVWPMADGRYAIIDGHHRIVDAIINGATEVEVLLPDVTLPDRTWSVLTDNWHEDLPEDDEDDDEWGLTAQHQNLRSLTDEGEADEYWEPYHEDQTLHDLGKPWPDENRFEDHDSLLFYGRAAPAVRIQPISSGREVMFEVTDGEQQYGDLWIRQDPLDEETYYVTKSEVKKSLRGQGYGRMLYDAAMDWAKENGVWLTPDVDISDDARRMWHRFERSPGYVKEPRPRTDQRLTTHRYPSDVQPGEEYIPWSGIDDEDIPNELRYRYRRATRHRRPPPHPGRRSGAAGDTKRGGAGVLLVDEDGRVFLGCRAESSSEPGTWCPPGGGVEDGEELTDAARRELWEEFGLEVTGELDGPWTVTRPDGFSFATFLADGSADMVPDMDESEHSDCGWFELSDLPQPLHPGFEALLDVLLSAEVAV